MTGVSVMSALPGIPQFLVRAESTVQPFPPQRHQEGLSIALLSYFHKTGQAGRPFTTPSNLTEC